MAAPQKSTTKVRTSTAGSKPVKGPETKTAQGEATSTALATQGTKALAGLPEIDLAQDALAFQDSFDRSSIQIPFLQILQSNSPQVKPGESKYIQGAQMSMLYNTVTNSVYEAIKKGVTAVPCYHYATIIQWRLREKGGGFIKDLGLVVGQQLLSKTHKDEKGREVLPDNETHLVLTEVYFLLLIDGDGGVHQMMCTMTSTQLKKARNWNSRIMNKKVDVPGQGPVQAPMFFYSYLLKTCSESNAKGSWYGWLIEDGQPTLTISKQVYLAARAFRETMQKGVAAGNVNLAGAEDGGGQASNQAQGEDVPF